MGSTRYTLNGLQILDQPIDQRVDAGALGGIVHRFATIELPTPHRHVSRPVRLPVETAVDGSANIFCRKLTAVPLCDPSKVWHVNLDQRRDRAVAFLVGAQSPDGGWGGDAHAPVSIEETALAVEALAGLDAPSAARAAEQGAKRLGELIEQSAEGRKPRSITPPSER